MGKYKALMVNLGLFALNTVATRLIVFFLVPLYTYYLSAEEFGITDMATTVRMLLIPLVTLSTADAALRFIIDDSKNTERYVSIAFLATTLSSIVAFCILPLLDLNFFGGLGHYKLQFLLVYASGAFQTYFSNIARGLNQIKLMTWSSLFSSLVTSGTAAIFIAILHYGVNGYLYSMSAGSIVGCLIYLIAGRQFAYIRIKVGYRSKDALLFRKMCLYAVPLIPNSLFWWMGTSINRFFITGMMGIGATGLFAAATKLPNLIDAVYQIFQQAWTLSAFQEYRKSGIGHFFTVIYTLLQAVMSSGTSAFIILSSWLASFMLQKDFFNGWTLMPILAVAVYFNALNAFYGSVFTSSMKTRTLMSTTAIGAIVCVGITWAFIPSIGLFAPCIAMVASNAVVLVQRMIRSTTIMRIDVNLPILIATILLLAAQCTTISLKVPRYMVINVAAFAILCGVQLISIFPIVKQILQKDGVPRHPPRHAGQQVE
ncbi:lipopolysaccharide biosynthesis protein [Bifidobacterium mongoliense]|uniref:lipopolysaccharide biosynthesis protein n=1 Tax=Bifidobacterium mongoliense TaxID=518643 RepID=UPI0030ED4E19